MERKCVFIFCLQEKVLDAFKEMASLVKVSEQIL
jgi:hypothetical protein